MGDGVVILNLQDVLQAIDKSVDNIMQGAQIGIGRAGLAVERQAKLNANTGTRKYKIRKSKQTGREWLDITPDKHIGPSGKGPNVVTGNLRRSIRTTVHYGFGTYVAEVGPTMIYARQVEKGGGNWKSGVKYPYLEPAALTLLSNGTIERVFVTAIREKMRG